MIYIAERWKMTAVLVLLLLLTGLAYVGELHAQIKKDEVDFEVMATVTMVAGDTLWDLAEKHYEDPLEWAIIKDLNRIPNERRIPIGTVVYIPVKEAKKIVKKVEAEIEEKKVAVEEVSAQIGKLKKDLDRARKKSKEYESKNKRLAKSVRDLESKNKRLARSLKDMKDKDAAFNKLEAQVRELRAAVRKKDAVIEDLEAELRELRAAAKRHRELVEAVDRKERQIEELESKLRRSRGDIEELERARNELRAKIERAEAARDRDRPPRPVRKPAKKPTDPRSRIAAVAIALVGSIIWIASD